MHCSICQKSPYYIRFHWRFNGMMVSRFWTSLGQTEEKIRGQDSNLDLSIAVGTAVASGPPHRSVRECLPHTAPTLSRA